MGHVCIAPAAGTSIRVKELESGRGYTHVSIQKDEASADGVTTLVGRRRCLTPWIEGTRVTNGVVIVPSGATASVEINGALVFPEVRAFRPRRKDHAGSGAHEGMYFKQGEPSFHHIERGRDNAVTLFTDDLSGGITMWTE